MIKKEKRQGFGLSLTSILTGSLAVTASVPSLIEWEFYNLFSMLTVLLSIASITTGMVALIKSRRKVLAIIGISVSFFAVVFSVMSSGFNDGYLLGYEDGVNSTYDSAYQDGLNMGSANSQTKADEYYKSGYSHGKSNGYNEGYNEAIRRVSCASGNISACR